MNLRKIRLFLSLSIMLVFVSSCGINSNIMFKIPKGSTFKYDPIPMRPSEEYKISPGDKITFTVSNNYGHRIIESQAGVNGSNQQSSSFKEVEYIIRPDSMVDLPVIGEVRLAGFKVKDCEDTLARLFSREQNKPFVQVRVTNQRVIVFPGDGSDAKVIPLNNNNTTLMEAIAQAGGITQRGKANSVKLIRNVKGKREVYLIDLSTIDGLVYTDMIVQSNDYIYVEPNPKLAREALAQAAPFVTVISSMVVVLTVLSRLK